MKEKADPNEIPQRRRCDGKLSFSQAQEIREQWQMRPRIKQRLLANRYGVAVSIVSKIVTGKLWVDRRGKNAKEKNKWK